MTGVVQRSSFVPTAHARARHASGKQSTRNVCRIPNLITCAKLALPYCSGLQPHEIRNLTTAEKHSVACTPPLRRITIIIIITLIPGLCALIIQRHVPHEWLTHTYACSLITVPAPCHCAKISAEHMRLFFATYATMGLHIRTPTAYIYDLSDRNYIRIFVLAGVIPQLLCARIAYKCPHQTQ